MPNARVLRQIVAALRGLVWKARDADSPASAAVLTMAAGAVRDIASASEEPAQQPEQVARRIGDKR